MPQTGDLARRLAVARGDEPADLVVRGGRVLSVFTREWLDADVAICDGTIAGGFPTGPSLAALQTLRDLPEHNNLDAQIQGLLDALDFGLSVGVTTHVDQGSFHFAPDPAAQPEPDRRSA